MAEKKDVGIIVQGGGTIGGVQTIQSGSVGIIGAITVGGTVASTGTVNLPAVGGMGTVPTAALNIDPTSTLIADANAARNYLAIQNFSGTNVYISAGSPAIAASGIAIAAAGRYEFNLLNSFRGSVFGISAGGTAATGKVSW